VLNFLRVKGKAPVRTSQDQAPTASAARGFSFARVLVLLLMAVALAGCQLATRTPTPTAAAGSPEPTPAPPYPLELPDHEGTTVTIERRPQRIVSLTPATTEIVFALGAGDRLVGRGDYDDYPPAVLDLPGVATFTGVEHEELIALEPDLVLAGGNNFTAAADVDRMRDLDIPVLVVYAGSVADVLGTIRLIGLAIDAPAEADTLVTSMQARMTDVTAAVRGLARPRVFYQLGSEPEIYGPAPDSFVADMVSLAGGEPITTTDPAVFAIAVERLVAEDPEVIVLGDAQYGVCPAAVAARPGWGSMTAVREGAIRPVYDTIVTRPGPRLAEGLAALALAIHPDAAITPPADLPPLCVGQSP
jgi:iron complex transport system substrate-binding protein